MAILKFLSHAPPSHNSQLVSAGHWVTAVFCDTISAGIQSFNLDLNFGVPDLDSIGSSGVAKRLDPAFPWVTVEANVLLDLVPLGQGGVTHLPEPNRGDFRGICYAACHLRLDPSLFKVGTALSSYTCARRLRLSSRTRTSTTTRTMFRRFPGASVIFPIPGRAG